MNGFNMSRGIDLEGMVNKRVGKVLKHQKAVLKCRKFAKHRIYRKVEEIRLFLSISQKTTSLKSIPYP